MTTFAGGGGKGDTFIGIADGVGVDATFNAPYSITSDRFGQLYVAEEGYAVIRIISPLGNLNLNSF